MPPLQPGASAPAVTLVAHTHEPVAISDFRGKQPVVILFFPLAFTSTCTEELCSVRDDLATYDELSAQVFAVSVDSPYVLNRYRQEIGAEYPFLSDFHREAAEAFGVLRTAPLGPGLRNTTDRSAFVIDRDGKIAYTWHSTNPSLIPPFDEIKQALRNL